ncbi:MoxR family ATPase [Pelagibius sp. Alg239-R121]|uniref:AAA family ATPase n=1 Tax=Pelagibius sp. Alg239-R121 TaxID=2993448 RepID=UPI0024A7A103|nr:MoxR family ATPase [Pelagibius sp. Alg239-R121]
MTKDAEPYKTFTGTGALDYVISRQDAMLVDLAIKLGRPLLVEGEAGCGKSTLAEAIATELDLGDPITVPIRSSSRSNDLFYRYDGLVRLQDRDTDSQRSKKAQNYITLEPVGRAIVEGQHKVVLIDEIDKADMDFQNDLLFALERFEFRIDDIPASETKKVNGVAHRMVGEGSSRPIIMFTSNQEKLLPKPFLRRCFYLELKFPSDPARLEEIVIANLRTRAEKGVQGAASLKELNTTTVSRAVASFLEIREAADKAGAMKKPATAELLDWVHALHIRADLATDLKGLHPPLWEILFRTAQDKRHHADSAGG